MTTPRKNTPDAERKAAAFLTRKKPSLEQKSPGQIAMEARTAVEQAAREKSETMRNLEIGQMVEDEGIFTGTHEFEVKGGLMQVFNAFAAPEDLPGTMKYADAVRHLAELKGWHGHDGTSYATDKEFYQALKDGSYDGGWIMPTCEILCGKDVEGRPKTPDNLYERRGEGALAGTFKTKASKGSVHPDWYWSSAEYRANPDFAHVARFSDGESFWHPKSPELLSCRPVRLVKSS